MINNFIAYVSKNSLKILFFTSIVICIIMASWFVIHGDIFFHTDIARDFLLLEDMVKNKPITLIGPRSGGISGVFHGPLWLYLNLPIFILSQGNPVFVGWFWTFLFILTLVIIYIVGKNLFDQQTGALSALLFAVCSLHTTPNLFNPFGAVMLSPLFFFYFVTYIRHGKLKDLLLCLFVVGLIIQFQMAFGLPILILSFLYLVVYFFKRKRYHHFLSFSILLIPLSTFILFDIRHNFLQLKAITNFLSAGKDLGKINLQLFFLSRIKGVLIDGFVMMSEKYWFLILASITIPFILVLLKIVSNKKFKNRDLYILFFYFYLGFWLITFFYKGTIWSYYYWPILPLAVIIFSSLGRLFKKNFFYLLFASIFLVNFIDRANFIWQSRRFINQDAGSWRFNLGLAEKVFDDAGSEFGYFIYTPDQFGYSPRYALNYLQAQYKNKQARPFEKKPITYLLISPPPEDRPFLKGDWWKINRVKIAKKPEKVFKFKNGFIIEKYILTPEEINIQADPNLIQSLHFR